MARAAKKPSPKAATVKTRPKAPARDVPVVPKRAPGKKGPKPKVARASLQVVSTSEMAEVLGLTARRLQMMASDGDVPTEGRGRWQVGAVVQAYAALLKDGSEKKAGSASLDRLREEKALDIQLTRMRKDRTVISMDEAIGVIDDIVGIFVTSLQGLPARISGVPRERQKLDGIFDTERQRLADRFAERRRALLAGTAAADPAAEDDAA